MNVPISIDGAEGVIRQARMPDTLWTLILAARDLDASDHGRALARICEIYWYPLYVFICRQGFGHHEAEDLTQAFFARLFERPWLAGVERENGRFRNFMLRSLCNFLNTDREKQRCLKRGGHIEFVALGFDGPEGTPDPVVEQAVSLEFAREWACELVRKALEELQREYSRCGKLATFQSLAPFLARPVPEGYYLEQSRKLQMEEGALRVAMHRLVHRFAKALRTEVAGTVSRPELIEDELREVIQVWADGECGSNPSPVGS